MNSQVFCEDSEKECESIVWKMATAEVEKVTAGSLRGRNVGAPVTLGSFAHTNQKGRNDGT